METIGNGRLTIKSRTSHRARTTRSAKRNQRVNPERSGSSVSSVITCLLVGGGGGGGGANFAQTAGGGGGGGEVIEFQITSANTGSYAITIGAGGTGPSGWVTGGTGANSSAFGYTVTGGGGGGTYNTAATSGSSGGGEGAFQNNGAGTGTVGKGFDGGQALVVQNTTTSAGGGGGARGIGGDAASSIGGAGGAGYTWAITGLTYGGGGGGGGGTTGGSSSGGGGAGSFGENNGSAAPANRGGGGGGAMVNATNAPKTGGAGGSGVFIFTYATGSSVTAIGGTISYANGMTIHTFTSSGSLYVGPPKTVSYVGGGYDNSSPYVITSGELSAIGAASGDLIVAFGPYGGAVTGMTRTTFTWMYTMTIHWKIITASDLLSGFTCSPQLDYGPLSWAVYRGPSSVSTVYTGNATGGVSDHVVSLPAPSTTSLGFVHYITDRDGTTLGTVPTGYTSRVGSATGVFTGQIADRLSGNPTTSHTATWTGFGTTYDQGAVAFELLY